MAEQPELMNKWKDDWTYNIIKFSILSVVFFIAMTLLFSVGSFKEILGNFSKYRCNPLIMPFAGNFGYDPKDNFNFCLSSIFNSKAAEVFSPIYTLLGGFLNIVNLVVDVALGIRKLFSNFLLGVNSFVRSVRDRIQGLFFSIRMSFLKLNNLMGRVYGTMYAVIFMGTSAMTAGFNLADNDLVRFLFEFCFDPNTPVEMSDGTYRRICDINIGDRLATVNGNTPVVTSVFSFLGDRTSMVIVDEVVMSSEHYVMYNNTWICAKSHPRSIPWYSVPNIVCLNVTGHMFKVGYLGLVVSDYDEHDTQEIIETTQNMAMTALNGHLNEKHVVDDYSLGVDGSVFVRMDDGSWIPISNVTIGMTVWNAGKVLGVVKEKCDAYVLKNGNAFSLAQTVFDNDHNEWTRAGRLWPNEIKHDAIILYSLITEHCGTINLESNDGTEYFIRDYREVPLAEMEDAYEDGFL